MKLTAEKLKQLIREELQNESMLTNEAELTEDDRDIKSVITLAIGNYFPQNSPQAIDAGTAQNMAEEVYKKLLEKGLLKQK